MTSSGENDKFVTLISSLEGVEPVRRRVKKDLIHAIQSESSFFKEYIEDGATEIKIPLKRPQNLNCIVEYFYEEKLTVSNENHLESIWNDARILGLVNLEKDCIKRLSDTISLDSWIQRLEFSQSEGCHELESNVLSFVSDNFQDCCNISSFTSLRVNQMVQVLQLPTVQTTVTESNRIALILNWIKANEKDRSPQAYQLLEQVDLMKLTENSLRLFFDEESAFRNWRSCATFERAIKLKKLEETSRNLHAVRGRFDQFEMPEAHLVMSETLEGTRNIKQEIESVESFDANNLEVNENPEDCTRVFQMKQEFSPHQLATSVCEVTETNDNTDEDPPPSKISKLEYSQADIFATNQPRVSNQKQILYFRQSGQQGYNLNFVILNADSVSVAQRVQVNLSDYNNHVPKLIWSEEARGLFLLGQVNNDAGRALSTVRYMNGQRPLNITEGPSMLVGRLRFQPAILNGGLYAIGGSKYIRFKNSKRLSQGEVLDTTADSARWKWQPIDCAPMGCDLFTAAVAKGRIYIIGGLRETAEESKTSKLVVTDDVIRYEPTTNKWKFVSSMGIPRCGHASAVVGRRIYVFGGCTLRYTDPHEDLTNMRTAEVYDIEKDEWAVIAPMRRPRFRGSAVEVDGKIYVFGGDFNRVGKIPASVECYDPLRNSWTYVSRSVDSKGVFDSIAVIDNPEHFL